MNGPLRIDDVTVDLLGRRVLHPVGLDLPAGRWLSLIGPNGAGKTTLLRAICGEVPHGGRIRLGDLEMSRRNTRARARAVAVVPQRPERPEGMRVIDYVLLGRSPYIPYLGRESRQDLDVVADLLERLELRRFADRPVTTLSGGEFQRAVLARALAQEAPLLLLDEPTSSLDLGHAQQVLELVDELRHERGLTVVSALHDLTMAGQFSDELLLVVDGSVVAAGTARQVLTSENVSIFYGAAVQVLEDPSGRPMVIPQRPATRGSSNLGSALPAAPAGTDPALRPVPLLPPVAAPRPQPIGTLGGSA